MTVPASCHTDAWAFSPARFAAWPMGGARVLTPMAKAQTDMSYGPAFRGAIYVTGYPRKLDGHTLRAEEAIAPIKGA